MLQNTPAFSGFSVKSLDEAERFYSGVLGVTVEQNPMGLQLKLVDAKNIFIYSKTDHQPATYTVLNFVVEDIDQTINELVAKGVSFEQYLGMTDEKGVARGISANRGPDIAWFKDPSGNILSVLQES